VFLYVWLEGDVHGLTVITVPLAMDTVIDKSSYNFQANGMRREGVETPDITLKALLARTVLDDSFNEL
jgi:hypothetical protein